MSLYQFNKIQALSNLEVYEAIQKTEKELFMLRFKKATRQSFKSHEIKKAKCRLAQLKTVLSLRLNKLQQKNKTVFFNLFKK